MGKRKTDEKQIYQEMMNLLKFKDFYLSISDKKSKDSLDQILDEIKDQFVGKYVKSISSSQLRNVFHKINKAKSPEQLKLLRPNLAYLAARQQDQQKSKAVIKFIDSLITQVDESNLDEFKKFMEMVVAYHKYYSKN